jgi:hypothetical protein
LTETSQTDRFPYPRELVVGLFASRQQVEKTLETLEGRGFEADDYGVLHGEDDARSLDVEGEAHGFAGKLVRLLQQLSSYDLDHVRRHAEHLRGGGYVVAAFVGEDEDAKRRAADAMRSAGGDFVNYYADSYIESL